MPEPLLVGVKDAARVLGLGRDVTYQLVKAGRIRSVAVGRRRLVPLVELEEFVRRESSNGSRGGDRDGRSP